MLKKFILKNLCGPIFSIITPFDNKENIDFKNLKNISTIFIKEAQKFLYYDL